MSDMLHVARALHLPPEYVTNTGALLAVRGAGKTNAARTFAEEMFRLGFPFCAIDPVGSWYGLRAGHDGSACGGLPIFIFGGEHGDVEITKGSGEIVADTIIENRLASVVDISGFDSENDKKTFLLAFAKRLFAKNKDPLHLFLEEADDYIPQKPMRDEIYLLRVWENIVRRGRSKGLGVTFLTQRSAVLNKNVLTQVENLFVLRTTGPQDIKAIEAWTKYHQVDEGMLESLAGLEDGEAWVWSPHFLKTFKRFKFRLSHTFDSGATPKNLKGKTGRTIATLRDVDVNKLKGRIAETIEKAQQENSAVLRSHIVRLKAEVHNLQVENDRMRKTKIPVYKKVDTTKLEMMVKRLTELASNMSSVSAVLQSSAAELNAALLASQGTASPQPPLLSPRAHSAPVAALESPKKPSLRETTAAAPSDGSVGKCADALLRAIVQRHPQRTTAVEAALRAGYVPKSGHVKNSFGELRRAGFTEGTPRDLGATTAGIKDAGQVGPQKSGRELLEKWLGRLGKGEQQIVVAIYNAGEASPIARSALPEAAGFKGGLTGHFKNCLGAVRRAGLVVGKGEFTLHEVFWT